MDTNEIIGRNIKILRKARCLSREELASKLFSIGYDISAYMLGAWERNETQITAANLHALAIVLQSSEQSFFETSAPTKDIDKRFADEASSFSERTKETILYMRTEWEGDSVALSEWNRMYLSAPPQIRQEMSGVAISIYKTALHAKRFKPSLDVNLRLLEKKCNSIY